MKIYDTNKTDMFYVCSVMRMVDLTTTCVVTLIQGYGCSLKNEFNELTYKRIIRWSLIYMSTDNSLVGVMYVILRPEVTIVPYVLGSMFWFTI